MDCNDIIDKIVKLYPDFLGDLEKSLIIHERASISKLNDKKVINLHSDTVNSDIISDNDDKYDLEFIKIVQRMMAERHKKEHGNSTKNIPMNNKSYNQSRKIIDFNKNRNIKKK